VAAQGGFGGRLDVGGPVCPGVLGEEGPGVFQGGQERGGHDDAAVRREAFGGGLQDVRGLGEAAAEEDAIRIGQAFEGAGQGGQDGGDGEGPGFLDVAAQVFEASGVFFHGEDASFGAQHGGLQGHGTGPGPEIPDHVRAADAEQGQGCGPGRELGENRVVAGEGRIREAQGQGGFRGPDAFEKDQVQGREGVVWQVGGHGERQAGVLFIGQAHVFEDVQGKGVPGPVQHGPGQDRRGVDGVGQHGGLSGPHEGLVQGNMVAAAVQADGRDVLPGTPQAGGHGRQGGHVGEKA